MVFYTFLTLVRLVKSEKPIKSQAGRSRLHIFIRFSTILFKSSRYGIVVVNLGNTFTLILEIK